MDEAGSLILVADDEPHVVRLVQVNLERQGYRIETASDGQEALAKMRAHRPSLLVLDTLMPVLNGWEVLEQMAHDHALSDIPVVLLDADVDDEDHQRPPGPTPANVRFSLTKPFNPGRLLEALK